MPGSRSLYRVGKVKRRNVIDCLREWKDVGGIADSSESTVFREDMLIPELELGRVTWLLLPSQLSGDNSMHWVFRVRRKSLGPQTSLNKEPQLILVSTWLLLVHFNGQTLRALTWIYSIERGKLRLRFEANLLYLKSTGCQFIQVWICFLFKTLAFPTVASPDCSVRTPAWSYTHPSKVSSLLSWTAGHLTNSVSWIPEVLAAFISAHPVLLSI